MRCTVALSTLAQDTKEFTRNLSLLCDGIIIGCDGIIRGVPRTVLRDCVCFQVGSRQRQLTNDARLNEAKGFGEVANI